MPGALKVLRVTAGGRTFGIDAGLVRGLERPLRRVRLPGAPPWVRGVVEVRGTVVVVIDLATRLGLQAPSPADPVVVVVDSVEPVGLQVDGPGEVVTLDPAALRDLGPAGATAGLRSAAPGGAVLLDLEAIVDGRPLAPALGPLSDLEPSGLAAALPERTA